MIRGSLLKWRAGSRAVTCAGGGTGPATGDGAVRESVLRVGLGLIKRKVGRVTTIKVSSTIKYPKSESGSILYCQSAYIKVILCY